tara:strand:- start:812 stop:1273 length:462 start_codon:yes stop_codon:yes gene_type:complete
MEINIKTIFDDNRSKILSAVLNTLIPESDLMPSASQLYLEPTISDLSSRTPSTAKLILEGLQQIDILAMSLHKETFVKLPSTEQIEILKQIEISSPVFFSTLLRFTYDAYYSNTEIFEKIGYSIPNPLEYELTAPNEELLKPQKKRAPFWVKP